MKFVFGSMNFGPQVDLNTGAEMISLFSAKGYNEIDSAFVYNDGETERMLGKILTSSLFDHVSLATKVNPRISGKLDRNAVYFQLNESLARMGLESVDILYLHMPDPNTPIEETLLACSELFKQKKFRKLGLSNFPAWMVVDIWHICDKNNWPKPQVYQGLYNAISRKVENELFPCLRRFGISFYAFNPLAGGLLTGKQLDYNSKPEPGRFARLASYRKRYWKEAYFDAIRLIKDKCDDMQINAAHAAFRWLAYHSKLDNDQGDGIIIGASSLKQLRENIDSLKQGPLPEHILEVIDEAWNTAIVDSPEYFYFFEKESNK